MHFHVIVNQPGYSPMSEDFPRFNTIEEAWAGVVDELDRDYDNDLDSDAGWLVASRYSQAMATAMREQSAPGYVHVPGPTNTHLGTIYNVVECADSECPDED
jgi:hypothetical protein